MCNDTTLFTTFYPMDMVVGTCDGKVSMKVTGGGTVKLILKTRNNEHVEVTLTNVAFALDS